NSLGTKLPQRKFQGQKYKKENKLGTELSPNINWRTKLAQLNNLGIKLPQRKVSGAKWQRKGRGDRTETYRRARDWIGIFANRMNPNSIQSDFPSILSNQESKPKI
ncbi:hypothetical protein LINPERHAP1_LOCUS501, partial [Linum perenne]